MGTLASELGGVAEQLIEAPRIYADANLPAGLVRFMRERLKWDVFFVVEEDDVRRAADITHFHYAVQLRRTLITLDRDYLNDVKFPPPSTAGILVMTAPDEEHLTKLLRRVDESLFRNGVALPLERRKLHVHIDWTGEDMR